MIRANARLCGGFFAVLAVCQGQATFNGDASHISNRSFAWSTQYTGPWLSETKTPPAGLTVLSCVPRVG